MQEPEFINGLSRITDKYSCYIIDLWGVLHDGITAYPKALETLKNLKEEGKKIVLLSNAPRRSSKAKEVLDRLGFERELYDEIITSGEITFNYVKNSNLGNKYFYIGPEKDRGIFDGLDMQETENASEAGFAIVTGFEGFNSVFEEKKKQTDEALKAGLTLICANPDLKVVNQAGETQICAGMVAEYYEKNGGKVIYFGKPYEAAYLECEKILNPKNRKDILCIGDSIHTDIAGGNNFGADTLFIANGIHKGEFVTNDFLNLTKFKEACDNGNNFPTYIIKEFFW